MDSPSRGMMNVFCKVPVLCDEKPNSFRTLLGSKKHVDGRPIEKLASEVRRVHIPRLRPNCLNLDFPHPVDLGPVFVGIRVQAAVERSRLWRLLHLAIALVAAYLGRTAPRSFWRCQSTSTPRSVLCSVRRSDTQWPSITGSATKCPPLGRVLTQRVPLLRRKKFLHAWCVSSYGNT
jgi:hypothetical protein